MPSHLTMAYTSTSAAAYQSSGMSDAPTNIAPAVRRARGGPPPLARPDEHDLCIR